MDVSFFNCPDCHGELDSAADALTCRGCGREFPLENGLYNFCRDEVFWGEFDEATSRRLLDRCEQAGWRAAVEEVLAHRPDLIEYCTDTRRGNHLNLIPPDRRGALLDVGTGWGILASVASTLFESVHTIEAVPVRARFSALRFQQEGRTNVAPALASILEPPFARPVFDVVLMNGILEWIGDWNRALPPVKAQEATLRTVCKMLKPGGILVVGIENRFGYSYALGRRDHNGLWGTNVLPRVLATAVSLARKREKYRVYTYSLPALHRLFHRAGYRDLCSFAPHPGYNRPFTVISLDSPEPLQRYIQNHANSHTVPRKIAVGGAKALASLGLLKLLMPDFFIFARKPAE